MYVGTYILYVCTYSACVCVLFMYVPTKVCVSLLIFENSVWCYNVHTYVCVVSNLYMYHVLYVRMYVCTCGPTYILTCKYFCIFITKHAYIIFIVQYITYVHTYYTFLGSLRQVSCLLA